MALTIATAKDGLTSSERLELVSVRNVVKRFPGVVALAGVSLDLIRGEIHALLGGNGAGKSTLINILSGVYPPDSGELIVDGTPVTMSSPRDAHELGITTIHQELTLAPDLTALDNIFLGREPRRRVAGRGFLVDRRAMENRVRELCLEFEFDAQDLHRPAGQLGALKQHVVEILKSLAFDARLMILDEPTSGLADHERLALFQYMRALRSRGISILWVTHRLEELYGLADRATIFRDGKYVATVEPGAATPEGLAYVPQALVHMMVGGEARSIAQVAAERPARGLSKAGGDEEVLRVEGLSSSVLRNVSFTLRRGEILGVTGLAGAGRTTLARAILGAERIDQGRIYLNGKAIRIRSPHDAWSHGIALVPEERKTLGILSEFSVARNITVAAISRVARARLVIDRRAEEKVASKYVTDFGIRTPSVRQKIRTLSGGNQQKAIVARCLFTRPTVMILDEPTQGIDLAAKADVYRLVYDFVDSGGAAIVISSELLELLEVSDRILVMREGELAGEVAGQSGNLTVSADEQAEKIMTLATPGKVMAS